MVTSVSLDSMLSHESSARQYGHTGPPSARPARGGTLVAAAAFRLSVSSSVGAFARHERQSSPRPSNFVPHRRHLLREAMRDVMIMDDRQSTNESMIDNDGQRACAACHTPSPALHDSRCRFSSYQHSHASAAFA